MGTYSQMKFRKNVLPRTLSEAGAVMFLLAMIPATFWFELYVVLPAFYPSWSLWYTIHFACATFLMVNVTGNFVAAICTDTSIAGEMMPSTVTPGWRFCAVCETVSPPRSWHCNTCNTCILKRDHHCLFLGTCVGHYNQRYFLMFVIYMGIATLYGTYFNNYFIYHNVDFQSPWTFIKLIFPMAMLVFGLDGSLGQYYLGLYLLNIVGMVFTFAIAFIQISLITKGQVQHERNHRVKDYNFGTKHNLVNVLGERWYIAWLFPFIRSDLPHNGIDWKTNTAATETAKMR